MENSSAALDTSTALDSQPARAVEVDLELEFWVDGEEHVIRFPRDIKRVDALVESLYLCFGEPAVQSLFQALRLRVRTFQAEFDQVRPEESADPKLRAAAAKDRADFPWLAVVDQKYSRPQRQMRLEIGKVLIRRFMAAWDAIVSHEGEFLQWYERKLFAATRSLLGDKQVVLQKLWKEIYRVHPPTQKKDSQPATLHSVVENGIDVDDYVIATEDPEVRDELFAHTQALAKLWYDYRDSLYSLRAVSRKSGDTSKADASMAHVQAVHQKFRELAATLEVDHPTAIVAAKKFEQVLRAPVAYAPNAREKAASLQRCIIESLVEGYEGTMQLGDELAEALVFGPQSEPLEFPEPDDEYFLRPSTARLIAMRLTGEQLWDRDASSRSVWTQTPIMLRVDQEVARDGQAPEAADRALVPGFLNFFAKLDADERNLLAASAIPGTYVNRARNEVQRCIEEIRHRDKERMENAKQGIFAGGLALAWSTGGASFVVAGALDAILTLSETWESVLAYRSSRAKAALVMVSTEESFWQTPNLCDHVQKVASAIVTIAGDLVQTGAASHVVDVLSMAFMVIDQEEPDDR